MISKKHPSSTKFEKKPSQLLVEYENKDEDQYENEDENQSNIRQK